MEIKEFSESNIILQDCYNGHLAHFQYTSLSRLRKKFFHSTLMARHHISPMSTRLTNSHGFLVGLVASELNRSNNLLFMVLPSTSQSEGHSSVTLLGDHRVLENIWCIGAGNPNSRPIRDANSASSKVHTRWCL